MARMGTHNPSTGSGGVCGASGVSSTRGPGDQASPLDYNTRLDPLACALDSHAAEGVWEAESAYEQQADLYRMRLVCRKFNVVFLTHGFLLRNMVLRPHTSGSALK
ncbi:TPA: hypothetical protein ACH3X1_002137 [Trebouxia sp. C0004]